MNTPVDQTKEDGYYAVYHKQKSEYLMNQLNWFKKQKEHVGSYNIQHVMNVESLSVRALSGALQALVNRHEALRTTFAYVDGDIKQKITHWVKADISVIRLGQVDNTEIAQALIDTERKQFFDFTKGPLFKALVVHLSDNTSLLVFTINHIISDGWSIDVITRELLTLYQTCACGQTALLESLPVQARHFADWENRVLHGEWGRRCCAYWHSRLGPTPPVYCLSDLYKKQLAGKSTSYREVLAKEVEQCFPQLLVQPYYHAIFGTLHRVATHGGGLSVRDW